MPFINIKKIFLKIGLNRLILQANFTFLGNLKNYFLSLQDNFPLSSTSRIRGFSTGILPAKIALDN